MPQPTIVDRLEPRRLLATISGTTYTDLDGDGRIEAGDPVRAGVEVFLDQNANDVRDAGEAFTVSDADGNYSFTVSAGTYRVSQARTTTDLRTYPGTGKLVGEASKSNSSPSGFVEVTPGTNQIVSREGQSYTVDAGTVHIDRFYRQYYSNSPAYPSTISSTRLPNGTPASLALSPDVPTNASASVIMRDEMYLREASGNTVYVVDPETGALHRTITLPAGTYTKFTAMPDRNALLCLTSDSLLWIDPQDGSVLNTVSITRPASNVPSALAYANGTAYYQFYDTNYFALNVETGVFGPAVSLTSMHLYSADSASHRVTLDDTGTATLDFARTDYTPAAGAPILLTYRSETNDKAYDLAIPGTVAGATLTLSLSTVTTGFKRFVTVPAAQGTTYVTVRLSDLASYPFGAPFTYGFEVVQQLPGRTPQQYVSSSFYKVGGSDFNITASPSGYVSAKPRFTLTGSIPTYGTSYLDLVIDGQVVSSTPVTFSNTIVQSGLAFADGPHQVTAQLRTVDAIPGVVWSQQRFTSSYTSTFTVTVDSVPPTISLSYEADAAVPGVLLVASEPVSGSLASLQFTLDRVDADGNVLESMPVATSGSAARLHVKAATGRSLADGRYRLSSTVVGTLTDRAGNLLTAPAPFTFTVLSGDANQDGVVNFDDLLVVSQNYGQSGKTFSQGNFDYSADGLVNFDDLLILAQHYTSDTPSLALAPKTTTPTRRRPAAGLH